MNRKSAPQMRQKAVFKVLLLLLILVFSKSFSQVKTQGTPFVKNYPSVEYKSHPKNFSIIQDDRGVMYFGNAYGILEFDGNDWRTINLPKGKSAISFAKDSNGRIYVGSVSEIGFLQADSVGNTVYTSFLNKLPGENQNFGEALNSFALKEQRIFASFAQISIVDKEAVKIFRPGKSEMVFDYSGQVGEDIFFRESGKGLVELTDGRLKLVEGGEYFANKIIYTILPFNSKERLIVSEEGLSIYDGVSFKPMPCPVNDFILKNPITKGISLKNNFYALGSINNGLIIIDNKGNPVQYLNKRNGLPSDFIYDLYLDSEENLWVATDNGISYVQISSSFTSINEDVNLSGMGYAAIIDDNKIYLGTSQGLFVKEWDTFKNPLDQSAGFHLIKDSESQTWYLDKIGGALLCGNMRGLFVIKDDEAAKISPGDYTGGWVFKSFKNGKYLILGTFTGLELYEKKVNTWVFKNKIKGFDESSRTLEIDNEDNLWVLHGNNGLYKIILNEKLDSAIKVTNYCVAQNFKSDYFNDIAKIGNEMVFAGDSHFYKYNKAEDLLERHTHLNKFIGKDILISKTTPLEDGSIWLVNNDALEVWTKQSNGDYLKNNTIFRKLKGQLIGSYEYFWRYDEKNYFIGTQNGFVHFDPTIAENNKAFNVIIRKVESINEKDSLLFAGTFVDKDLFPITEQPSGQSIKIPFNQNALRFSFSALYYEDQERNQYRFYLEEVGKDNTYKWTNWSSIPFKEYTNLAEGDYIFHVRAKNIYDKVSADASYSFSILPPWYRTKVAFFIYAILIILFLVLIIKLVLIKINKEKQRIEKEKEKELLLLEKQFAEEALKAEKEIILLQNEKLESEVRYKNDELANLATSLSQKTEFLSQLKKDLVSISKEINPENKLPSLTELIKSVDKGIEFDDSWDHFQTNFDTIHHNFLYKIRERFPALKPTDLLLCAYIKMNKSNKEISSLLNISVSAVEKRRFRLREKFKLDDDTRLTEFLIEV